MSTSPLRGRGKRLWTQQLPPGAPPDWAPPGRSQPLPAAQRMAQVFSTYAAAPVGARMFAEAVTATATYNTDDPPSPTWVFDLDTPPGSVRVLRAVRLLPPLVDVGVVGRFHVRLPMPGRMSIRVRLNKQPVPQVGDESGSPLANMGEWWPVYVVVGEQDKVGAVVSSGGQPEWLAPDNVLRMVFYGDMLRARNLPKELEVGHEAPLVRVRPEVE